jgi:hypothetical protein
MNPAIASSHQQKSITGRISFRQRLREIVENTQILPDLTIMCNGYEPLLLEPKLQRHLQQIPHLDRNHYLAVQLRSYWYRILICDLEPESSSEIEESDDIEVDDSIRANYVKKWSRTKFYRKLTQNNHGQGYPDPDWIVTQQDGKKPQVTKKGLTLYISPDQHLAQPSNALYLGQSVSIKMPPNLIDHGTYIAVGDAGSTCWPDVLQNEVIIQLYFNVGADDVVVLMDVLTQELNALQIPFDFRVSYDEEEFHAPDAAILEIQKHNFNLIYPILQSICQHHQIFSNSDIPFFCKQLLIGLGLAEKPLKSTAANENIGQYCVGIFAKSFIEIWEKEDLTYINQFETVLDCLSNAGIDIDRLYLNPDSVDIYELNLN